MRTILTLLLVVASAFLGCSGDDDDIVTLGDDDMVTPEGVWTLSVTPLFDDCEGHDLEPYSELDRFTVSGSQVIVTTFEFDDGSCHYNEGTLSGNQVTFNVQETEVFGGCTQLFNATVVMTFSSASLEGSYNNSSTYTGSGCRQDCTANGTISGSRSSANFPCP